LDYYIIDDTTIDWIFCNYFQWCVDNNDEIPDSSQLHKIKRDGIKRALKRKTYGTAALLNKDTYQSAEDFKGFLKIMFKHTDKFGG